jgi:hypothetical protein
MCRTSTEGFGQNALAMIAALRHLLGWLFSTLRSREDILLENLALRQQLLVLRSQRSRRRLATVNAWCSPGRISPGVPRQVDGTMIMKYARVSGS